MPNWCINRAEIRHKDPAQTVRHRMAERGRLTFQKYCELDRIVWVEASTKEGRVVVLHVGREEPSSVVPGLVRRPYRLVRVRKKAEHGGPQG